MRQHWYIHHFFSRRGTLLTESRSKEVQRAHGIVKLQSSLAYWFSDSNEMDGTFSRLLRVKEVKIDEDFLSCPLLKPLILYIAPEFMHA